MSEFKTYDVATLAVDMAQAIHHDLTTHHLQVTELRDSGRSTGTSSDVRRQLEEVLEHLESALRAMEGMNQLIVDMPVQLADLAGAATTRQVLDILRTNRSALETASSEGFVETTLSDLGSASTIVGNAMADDPDLVARFQAETSQQVERLVQLCTFCLDLLGRIEDDEITTEGGGQHRA